MCSLFCISHFSIASNGELDNLDFESLLAADVQITSVMKRTNKALSSPASVYVISNQQMLNAGVTSVAQALTLAPGMQVRKIDNNKWAIGIRNNAGRYTSRLLVMIDGQSIYNPSFSGVYWEALNLPIYDIERIEIVKGQGGLLWGSNATNGVVNIITKISNDTRSTRLNAKAGTTLQHDISIRHGDDLAIGKNASYRIYLSSQKNDKSDTIQKWTARDKGEKNSIGTRVDISLDNDSSILIQGDYTDIKMGQTLELADSNNFEGIEVSAPQKREHTQLMLRFDNRISSNANQTLQASYAKQKGEQPFYTEEFTNWDIDYQVNTLFEYTQLDFGINYRFNKVPFVESDYLNSENNLDTIRQYGGFIQANIALIDNELNLILGNKSEHNSFTGWEHQPSVRFAWQLDNKQFIWASFSQGVRTPSLIEYDYNTQVNGLRIEDIFKTGIKLVDKTRVQTFLRGNKSLESEKITSTELGYRIQQHAWNADLSIFYSVAKHAFAITPSVNPTFVPTVATLIQQGDYLTLNSFLQTQTIDFNLSSDSKQRTYGADFILNWQINPTTSMAIGASFAHQKQNHFSSNLLDVNGHTKQIFFSLNKKIHDQHNLLIQNRWESGGIYKTSSYIALDIVWNWQLNDSIKLTLAGNNLLESRNSEYARSNDTYDVATFIDRSIDFGVMVDF